MNNDADKTQLIPLNEIAELYGFSADYLRQLVHKGRLKAQKFGHIWATTRADMEDYLESRQKRGILEETPQSVDN